MENDRWKAGGRSDRHTFWRDTMPSAGGVEFVGLLRLILEPLKEPGGAHAGRGSITSVGRPEASQNSLNHRRLLIRTTRRSRPPQRGRASTSTPKVRRINSA